MLFSPIVSWLPLVDEVFVRKIVAIVVEMAFSDFQISKSDSSRDPSQVGKFDPLLGQEVGDFNSLRFLGAKHLDFLLARVIACVGNGSEVALGVPAACEHRYCLILMAFY